MSGNYIQFDDEQHYRLLLLEDLPQMVWAAEPDGAITYFNRRWYDYTGLTYQQSQGSGWQAALHPDDLVLTLDRWHRALKTGDSYEVENRFRRVSDGVYRWHLSRALPMRDAEGRIVRWLGTATDIDDQKRASERFRFVAEASRLLGLSLDYETTLRKITRLIVPYLADWCSIDLVDKTGTPQPLVVAHADPSKAALVRDMAQRYPPDPEATSGLPNVVRTGQSELLAEIPDEPLLAAAKDAEHLRMIRELGMKSRMIVPLWSRGRVLGTMTLVLAEAGRHYSAADLALAEDLARRAAIAVDNAQLYTAAQKELEDRKRVEQELKRSKDQLEVILSSVADGITLQDASGKLIYANDVAAHSTGYSSVEALLQAPPNEWAERFDIMNEAGQPFPPADLPGRLALQGKRTNKTVIRFVDRATGEERWVVVKATPVLDAEGRVQFAVNVMQDITESKRAEQAIRTLNAELEQRVAERTAQLATAVKLLQDEIAERRRAQQALHEANDRLEIRVRERTADLKAANDELSTFTYIVSHDLRAPLVNLKGFAAELRTSLGSIAEDVNAALPYLDSERQRKLTQTLQIDIPEALEFINSSVSRMDHLTSAVLKLSRLGRRELIMEHIDVNALVQTILNSLAHQIKQQGVQVTISDLPPVVADRVSMEQIMANLLTNALLYLRPDCPGAIEISGETNGRLVTYHVRDNGRGIADEDRHKVFEPFRRAGKQNVAGEGMGLAYVQALVRRHSGRIWYESKVDEGTTFSFTIVNNVLKNPETD